MQAGGYETQPQDDRVDQRFRTDMAEVTWR